MAQELSSADRLARVCEELPHIDPEDFEGDETLARHGIEMLLEVNERANE